MSSVISDCPLAQDPCQWLKDKINESINRDKRQNGDSGTHGLKHRFREQIEGSGPQSPTDRGPSNEFPNGSNPWMRHESEIETQQKRLRQMLNDYNQNGCGSPLPADAWEWATKPAPSESDWKTAHRSSFSIPQPPTSTVPVLIGVLLIGIIILQPELAILAPAAL